MRTPWWMAAWTGWLLAGCQPAPSASEPGEKPSDPLTMARLKMVQEQIAGRDVRNPRVLKAMETVPRHEFVPAAHRSYAYDDCPLPIGYGQTISQPYIVAFMTEKLNPQPDDRILEIGTGSGYQAAVLSCLVKEVYSIEIVTPLADEAARTLDRLGYANVKVKAGDGYLGWAEFAPFDAVIVTCAPNHIPQPLIDQLKEGGRLIIPVGDLPYQELVLVEKKEGRVQQKAVLPVRFVPMTGRAEKQEAP